MNDTATAGADPAPNAAKDEQRAAILMAARELLREEGATGLSARALARKIGLSTKVIYSHFGGMGGVIDAIHRDAFAELAQFMDLKAADVPLDGRLSAMALGYRHFLLGQPALFTLMFEGPAHDVANHVRDRSAAAPALLLYARTYMELQAQSGSGGSSAQQSDRARQAAYALWAATHGAVVLEARGWLKGRAVFDQVLASALAGNG